MLVVAEALVILVIPYARDTRLAQLTGPSPRTRSLRQVQRLRQQ